MYLRVEHRRKDFKKTWKLESSKKIFSLGHSRYADIRTDGSFPGVAGVFEFIEDQWCFTHLTPPKEGQPIERYIPIHGPTLIPFENSEIHVLPFEKKVQLLNSTNTSESSNTRNQLQGSTWIWMVWTRNGRAWFSEFVPIEKNLSWPHNKKPLSLKPTSEWQEIESEGVTLKYKLSVSPETKSFMTGSFKGLFDPSLRPYILGAIVACIITGILSLWGTKNKLNIETPPKIDGMVVQLKKPTPPTPPKNAVAKALAQTTVPKTHSTPKAANTKTLGKVFSMIGKRSLKNLGANLGPKTISVTSTTTPTTTSSKTFKVLGNLGSGTGLQPSQFGKKSGKDGGVGLGGAGSIGGTNLGQISQGNVGQGELGLLHKESEVSGGLDREIIAKYIQSQKGKILFCYERQLSANPGLFGKVAVKFQIAPGGEVETYNIIESTLGNNSVESCLLQLISQWRFPKPEGGVRVLVSYPFVFKSLN